MSEQAVKRYAADLHQTMLLPGTELVLASDYDALQSRLDAAERKLAERDAVLRDWRHAAHVRPSCQLGVVEHCNCMRCVESRTGALLSSAEPVKCGGVHGGLVCPGCEPAKCVDGEVNHD